MLDMTDQQLNDALRILLGWTKIGEHPDGHFGCWQTPEGKMWGNLTSGKEPDYCNDPAASLEVQAKAIELDRVAYVNNLYEACYEFKRDKDSVCDAINIAFLLNGSPRQRAEAAYMTLSKQD